MLKLIIDQRETKVEKGLSILEAASKIGIKIPSLCHHPAVRAYGACRLCVVEVYKEGLSKLTTSCNYIVEEGIQVKTDSERIKKARKVVIEMLLARCPNVKVIQDLAKQMGVKETRFNLEHEDCILCGLCVRVCKEVIKADAIGFANRGVHRKVTSPFEIQSDACIGCGACAVVCPTGAIKIEDIEDKRKIDNWHTELKRAKCERCGGYFIPEMEIDQVRKKGIKELEHILKLCPRCRRDSLALALLNFR